MELVNVLRRMVHPRTGKRLTWPRVADYFHASERIWVMAEALFGKGTQESSGWATRMLKSLKKPSGISRVLHSAASHFHRRQLSKTKTEEFWKAYRYIQSRTRHMRYMVADLRRLSGKQLSKRITTLREILS